MRKALRARQFGAVLEAYREAYRTERGQKVTQAEVGQWLGISQVHVGRLERRVSPADNLTKLARWSGVLGIPARCLWFPASQSSDVYEEPSDLSNLQSTVNAEGDDVRRRQFLKTAGFGVATVGTSLLTGARRAHQPIADTDLAENPDVAEVRAFTETYRRLDNRFGGGHSRMAMSTFITGVVEPKLRNSRATGRARNELFSAVAELHQLAGWMAYDIGQAGDGRRHMREAWRLSENAGDDALAAEMQAGMSHHAAFHGDPDNAVDLALASGQIAKRLGIPLLGAEAAVMEAHGLALQKDRQGSLTALRRAEHLFSTADLADAPAWLGYFDSAYLAAKFAHTFRDLGQTQDAELFARQSLEMSDGYERGKLFNTALLASILADQGRVDEASKMGSSALHMSASVRSVRSAAYLADLAKRLEPYRGAAEVRSLYGTMVNSGIPVPKV
ncbi:MAG TPA: XRE family transcriptional regulator [Pseudonocardiaceae bacterium]|jgi:transcriptional regulator with XRE-family HTH domain|nr:XRE family transcriptional regulator [Pseudonocardiaceae bacterium]